jgi:hypothetical protein
MSTVNREVDTTPLLCLGPPAYQESLTLPLTLTSKTDRLIFIQVATAKAFVTRTYGGVQEFCAYTRRLPNSDKDFILICKMFVKLCYT